MVRVTSTLAKHHSSLCGTMSTAACKHLSSGHRLPIKPFLGTRRKRSADVEAKVSPFHLHVISFWVAVLLVGPCLTTQCDLFKLQSSHPWFLRGRVPGSPKVLKFMDAQVPQSWRPVCSGPEDQQIQPTMDRMAAFSIAGWLNPNTDGQLYTLAETTCDKLDPCLNLC